MKPKFSTIVGVILMGLRSEGIFTMMTYDKYGQCVLEQFSAIPMGIPGKYRIPYSREIQVLDTDYENYAILEFVFHLNKEKHIVLKLYSRTFFARPNDINTFKEFWAERDYTEDQIYMLDNDEKCTKVLLEVSFSELPFQWTRDLTSVFHEFCVLGK
ncbi:epididymal-specific lipocalin-5-like [Sminthopsis crassicaudata]|uniref:epididymal-specific lipocalin-5-like n=1 Tax=Sminthopsis crassicaudata TaxID=9301 RepID=UPI003D69D961